MCSRFRFASPMGPATSAAFPVLWLWNVAWNISSTTEIEIFDELLLGSKLRFSDLQMAMKRNEARVRPEKVNMSDVF